MKVNITVDCTPDEARAFLGLPNIAPMQEAAMKQMQASLEKAAQTLGPESVMKTLFPENMADMQKAFWTQFTKGASGT
jgi:ABC-type sulfate transport system permease component